MLTFDQIKELIELVRDGQLQGLEIEERSGQRIQITGRFAGTAVAQVVSALPASLPAERASAAVPAAPAAPAAVAGETPTSPAGEAEESGHVLPSPIVGTFYTAPSPDSAPFVTVGATVRKGQVLCIVEAMKLMNEIESDVDGVVKRIYPKNAQPVEYGEPLFLIETA